MDIRLVGNFVPLNRHGAAMPQFYPRSSVWGAGRTAGCKAWRHMGEPVGAPFPPYPGNRCACG